MSETQRHTGETRRYADRVDEAYGSSEGGPQASGSVETEEAVDLGWEVPETSKRRKKATEAAAATTPSSTDAEAAGKDAERLADEARVSRRGESRRARNSHWAGSDVLEIRTGPGPVCSKFAWYCPPLLPL